MAQTFTGSNESIIETKSGFDSVFTFKGNVPPIAVVGDLQRTSIWELAIGREQNDLERKEIVDSISKQNEGLLVLLGDLVFEGSSKKHWKYFDSLFASVKKENIPVSMVLGNHEYFGKNYKALNNVKARFPRIGKQHWYAQIYDNLGLIYLDSNIDEYEDETWNKQIEWFSKMLNYFDEDSEIKGVLVFLHHPPYSNSLLTGDEISVQKSFVPEFLNAKKTLAMISGHAHTYERFHKDGKTFIVSGGGGGPRVKLDIDKDDHKDLYKGPSPRPFNYLLINEKENGISITVKGLIKGEIKFRILENFFIYFY